MKPLLSSPVARIGVIRNPYSTLSRAHYGVSRAAALDSDILIEQSRDTGDIAQILRHFRDNEIGIIVIDGGDGTVREVLSQCPAVFAEDMPAFCVLPSGKTNVCAHDTGTARYRRDAFHRLLERRKEGIGPDALRRRPVLGIEWEDAFHAPLHGMLLGFAGYREATSLAQSRVHSKGLNHRAAVAVTLISFFYSAIFGNDGNGIRAGEDMAISYDGEAAIYGPRFGAIMTTLQSFVLGIWPFWNAGSGAISWLDIQAPPPRLLAAFAAVMRNRPAPWMHDAGYLSGSANSVTIETHKPFILDGETFGPGPSGRLRIDSSMRVDFIAP